MKYTTREGEKSCHFLYLNLNLSMAEKVIVLAVLCLSWTISASDGPFIVAHKKALLTRVKSDIERLSISIDIYNQGSATAYDVSLYDDNWSQDVFEIVAGNTSMSWERLDAGASVSHSFELEAKKKTVFHAAPAVITFRIPTKAALQEAFSTPILPLEILADRPPEKKFDWVSLNTSSCSWTNYITHILLIIVC
ncbi:uncharacterized protein LOC132047350 [Lycium ferocissimum]|uniref:uncharacterized protein LOC132047350 n=1 Tax=Lycium ferocissimum TaxID=112874 RepID=UPI0028151C5F|nr:uncharacterized protein LOC132047350 [Lycium ferocissimum]